MYFELLRRYQSVYVGRVDTQEIDFVTKNDEGYYPYFQVSATITHPETRERELAALLSIDDHYPKYLLTLDEIIPSDYQGIKLLNVLDYLLS